MTEPTVPYWSQPPPQKPRWPMVLALVAGALVLVLMTVVVVTIVRPTHDGQSQRVTPVTTPPTVTATTTTTTPTTTPPPPPPPAPPPSPRIEDEWLPGPTYSGSDPEVVAANHLNNIAADDSLYVSAFLSGTWVPQLSSKRSGTADDGGVYDNVAILNEHLLLRDDYGAKLTVKNGYWVSIAPYSFSTKAEADNWCAAVGRDSWHCFGALP